MTNQQAYNQWAQTYNEVVNPTRDLELNAKKSILQNLSYSHVLELGCGTGKNTAWLLQSAESVTAVDFSENMLAKARESIQHDKLNFIQADISQPWDFVQQPVDLITCSLVLEHIENLESIFESAGNALSRGGYFYIGELHPFKQYAGSKARFEKENETIVLDCFTHHISAFITHASVNNFSLVQLNEWFDDEEKKEIPRILTLVFQKK